MSDQLFAIVAFELAVVLATTLADPCQASRVEMLLLGAHGIRIPTAA